jgi:diguanylate cyclase (GGDEF)-like protein/PAS domain S-box-containing protein
MISKKDFFRPKIIIPLTFLLLINFTVGLTAYIYAKKNQDLVFTQTFKNLDTINNIKYHKLKIFFEHRFIDINTLAYERSIVKIAQTYRHTHVTKDSYIYKFLNDYEYSDMFLVEPKNTEIIFSAENKNLIGKKITANIFEESNLIKLYDEVLETNQTTIADTEFSAFNEHSPYLLIATPIREENKILSVLFLVLPSYAVEDIIGFRNGMGKTGESYLVGPDFHLRSNSQLKKSFNLINSFKEPNKYKVQTVAAREALSGEHSYKLITDYRDIRVLSAYKLFHFNTLHWALISEIDESELQQRFKHLLNEIIVWSIFISIVVSLMAHLIIMQIIQVSVLAPLKKSYKRAKGFEEIIHQSLNEIYIFDPDTLHFTYVNDAAINNCGYTYEEFLKMRPMDIKPEIDADLFWQIVKPLLNNELEQIVFSTKHKRKDGSLYDVEIRLQLMNIDNHDRFVAFINDVTKQNNAIKEKEKFYDKATHDYLTNIYNRQIFDEMYNKEFESFTRYGTPLSLILFDIDDFKEVNDTFGHDIGDHVLVELVNIVKENVRASDVFARWGGEEFVILMVNTDIDIAFAKANEIRKKIQNYKIEKVGYITCSFGVASPSSQMDPNSIFKNADKALYKAKANGKNNVQKGSS